MIQTSSLSKVSEKKQKDKNNQQNQRNEITITLDDVKQYLHENKHLLLQDKNKFTAETLMMLLDNDKLAALEDEFNEHPNGIELSNFVWLMKCAIVHSQEEKYELINGLIKLFQDIDINGDHHMEWSEFTQYIIDAVIGEKDAKFFDARFEREREMTENEIFDRAYSKKTKRYFPCKYFDNTTHQSHIRKVIYSPHVDYIICLEQNSSKLKFYTVDCKEVEFQQKKFFLQPPADEKQQPFILDFTVAESLNTIVATTSDRQFFFWENNLSSRTTKSFQLDVLQTGIWYLPVHKLWISAGADYNIRTWKFNDFEDQAKITHDKFMIAHLKIITMIEELISPRLVASGSLDGKIKLWDLTDPSNPPILITELRDPNQNTRGILGLSYSGHYGSNLLSYGFENHINVWCPEVSITRAFIGKLEGHSSLVQICKFMDMSPNVISIDDKCNVRIWDIRGLNTIQVINSDGQFSIIYDVAILSQKHDMFVLAGKRLAYYENTVYREQAKNTTEDIYPISIDFNTYYNQFCILTKQQIQLKTVLLYFNFSQDDNYKSYKNIQSSNENDMRIYDAMTGKLKKVFNDLADEKFPVDLSTFCLGARQRKFFVADNIGLIRQYNMSNGEYLKSVNTLNETESSEFTKKQSNIKRKENNQISQMIYVTEEKLLIAAYYDSTIRIYDEEESEESVLLKVMTGAHKDSEITSLAYSEKFSLIATGSTNGRIALWEFESGKLENILIAREKGEIVCLQFGEPYPVLLSAGAAGVINVWGIKGCPPQYKYKNIGRFINSYWENDGYQKVPITYMICETSIQVGVQKPFILDKISPVQRSSFDPIMKDEKKDDQGTKKKNNIFNFTINTNQNTVNSSTQGLTNINNNNQLSFPTETGYLAQTSPLPRDQDDNDNTQTFQPLNQTNQIRETFADYQVYNEMYLKSIDEKKRRFYIITGDQKGMLHILNLTEILAKRNIVPVKDERKKKYVSLRRKDFINAQKSVDTFLSAPDRRGEKLPNYVHTYNSILINRWEAHSNAINFMLRIPEPLCYASCSQDKTVKIWSIQAQCWGKIQLMKFGRNEWKFPYDWVENKLKDMEEVFDQIGTLDNEVLQTEEKEKVKMKYLSNQFFKETTQEDIKNKKHDVLYPPKQLTEDEILQLEKEELYIYRLKPKPYIDPIQQLRLQIADEEEKARFQRKKNEPFLKVKPIEEDLNPIKIFYKIIPNDKPGSQYMSVKHLQNQFESIDNGIPLSSLEGKLDQQYSRKASNMASEYKDSQSNLPKSYYKNRSSSKFTNQNRIQKGASQSNNVNNTVSQSQINKKSFLQDQKNSAFLSKQKSSILKQGNSLPSASLTSLVKPTNNKIKKGPDIYKKIDFRQIRPQTSNFDSTFVKDVRYSAGEGSRLVRIATDQYTYQQASLAPLKFFKDIDLIAEKNKFYVDLAQNYDGRLKKDLTKLNVGGNNNELNYDSDDSEKKPKKKTGSVKIVATSTFLNNPNRNKHKVLKTGEKIYVIEQDG